MITAATLLMNATLVAGAADWSCLNPFQTSVDLQGRRTFALDTPMGCWERKKQEKIAVEAKVKKAVEEKAKAEAEAKTKADDEVRARIRAEERVKLEKEMAAKAPAAKDDKKDDKKGKAAAKDETPPEEDRADWTEKWDSTLPSTVWGDSQQRCIVWVDSVPKNVEGSPMSRIDPGMLQSHGQTMSPQPRGECEVRYGSPHNTTGPNIRVIEEPDGGLKTYRALIVRTQYGQQDWIYPPKGYKTGDRIPGMRVLKDAWVFRVAKLAPIFKSQMARVIRIGFKLYEWEDGGPFDIDTIANDGLEVKTRIGAVDERKTNGKWSDKLPLGRLLLTEEVGYLIGPCFGIGGPNRPWRATGAATANMQNAITRYTVPMCI